MKLLDNRPGGKAQIAALRFSYSSILISTSAVLILEVLYFAITSEYSRAFQFSLSDILLDCAVILACKTAQFTSDPVLGSIITVAAVAVYAICQFKLFKFLISLLARVPELQILIDFHLSSWIVGQFRIPDSFLPSRSISSIYYVFKISSSVHQVTASYYHVRSKNHRSSIKQREDYVSWRW